MVAGRRAGRQGRGWRGRRGGGCSPRAVPKPRDTPSSLSTHQADERCFLGRTDAAGDHGAALSGDAQEVVLQPLGAENKRQRRACHNQGGLVAVQDGIWLGVHDDGREVSGWAAKKSAHRNGRSSVRHGDAGGTGYGKPREDRAGPSHDGAVPVLWYDVCPRARPARPEPDVGGLCTVEGADAHTHVTSRTGCGRHAGREGGGRVSIRLGGGHEAAPSTYNGYLNRTIAAHTVYIRDARQARGGDAVAAPKPAGAARPPAALHLGWVLRQG